jgi:predicted nucleic acid-binding protein
VTHVIVNDASCLIDLRKGRLLHVLCALPYRFIVPLPIRASELLDFTEQEWRLLDDSGMETYDLSPAQIGEAIQLRSRHARLSANDCMCLVCTRGHEEGILLTGDGLLRRVAGDMDVRVHGVLWIIDELKRTSLATHDRLREALTIWRDDKAVFLPPSEIEKRLRSLR